MTGWAIMTVVAPACSATWTTHQHQSLSQKANDIPKYTEIGKNIIKRNPPFMSTLPWTSPTRLRITKVEAAEPALAEASLQLVPDTLAPSRTATRIFRESAIIHTKTRKISSGQKKFTLRDRDWDQEGIDGGELLSYNINGSDETNSALLSKGRSTDRILTIACECRQCYFPCPFNIALFLFRAYELSVCSQRL